MSTPVTLTPGTLALDCYPSDPQTYYEQMIEVTLASLDQDFPGVVVGADEPPAEYQDRVWFRTTDLQWYFYVNGSWVRPHPTPASGNERRIWVGLETDLQTYDGGSPGAVGPTTGPMWEVDHNFDARFPIGPGTLPSTTAVVVTGTGGEETHALTAAEAQTAHKHWCIGADSVSAVAVTANNRVAEGRADDNYVLDGTPVEATIGLTSDPTSAPGATGSAHNNMPPYYGAFFIKRTARTLILA